MMVDRSCLQTATYEIPAILCGLINNILLYYSTVVINGRWKGEDKRLEEANVIWITLKEM